MTHFAFLIPAPGEYYAAFVQEGMECGLAAKPQYNGALKGSQNGNCVVYLTRLNAKLELADRTLE